MKTRFALGGHMDLHGDTR